MENNFDVVIVGAGISGINAAYRITTQCPDKRFTILENRFNMGGTWDLFKYPGIRSDSDLYTFGFPWMPWKEAKPIATGDKIQAYIKKCAQSFGLDEKIQYGHRVVGGDWLTDQQQWRLRVDVTKNGNTTEALFHAKFVVFGTGYYDYEQPLQTEIPGIKAFKGTTIHPQFWPEDFSCRDKKVVIIGSGATAITLLPTLAEAGAKVTMLQRSPSYIVAAPNVSRAGTWLRKFLPAKFVHDFIRVQFALFALLFFYFCRTFPNATKRGLRRRTMTMLPPNIPHDPHFSPKYNPWDQRLCLSPDGDFFEALRNGADIATGQIKSVQENGISLESGQWIDADVIITATGLKLRIAGGAKLNVDGKPYNFGENFAWKGVLLQNLPNAAIIFGYTMASWTLGADAAALHICRMLNVMDKQGHSSVVPVVQDDDVQPVAPDMGLSSTYLVRGRDVMPKVGSAAPWVARRNWFLDRWDSQRGDFKGLQFARVST